jgi:hypothetical protein
MAWLAVSIEGWASGSINVIQDDPADPVCIPTGLVIRVVEASRSEREINLRIFQIPLDIGAVNW